MPTFTKSSAFVAQATVAEANVGLDFSAQSIRPTSFLHTGGGTVSLVDDAGNAHTIAAAEDRVYPIPYPIARVTACSGSGYLQFFIGQPVLLVGASEGVTGGGAAGTAGEIPNLFVEVGSTQTISSTDYVDIPGASGNITIAATVPITGIVAIAWNAQANVVASFQLILDGSTSHATTMDASGTGSDITAVITFTTDPLAPGTYNCKVQAKKDSGSGDLSIRHVDLTVIAMQGPDVYTPGDPTSWDTPPPTTYTGALDRCAALLKTLNGGVGP